jgi:hypothetical protein
MVLFSRSEKFSLKIALTALSFSKKVGRRVMSDSIDEAPKISISTSEFGSKVVNEFMGRLVSF